MGLKVNDPTAAKRREWILRLFAAHVVVAVALGAIARLRSLDWGPHPCEMSFIGLVFAQTSLLGVWAGLSRSPWWTRLPGLAVGAVCMGVGGCVGIDEVDWLTFFVFACNGVMVAAVLTIFRCVRFRVALPMIDNHDQAGRPYGIRHLLILTLVVALMLWIGRHLDFGRFDIWFLADLDMFLAVITSSCVLIGVLSPWTMLREGLLALRGVILFVVAAAAGLGIAATEWRLTKDFLEVFSSWLTVYLTETIVLIVSLLVVRHCGYRLMRLPREQSGNGAGQVATPTLLRHFSQERE